VSADPSHGRDDSRSSTLNVLGWFNKPVDYDRLMQVLPRPGAPKANGHQHTRHVDADDPVETANANGFDFERSAVENRALPLAARESA
jgi:hypothetical protein